VARRWLSCALFAFATLSVLCGDRVRAQSPAEDLLKAQQAWYIECIPKGCIASVDILRGESGDAPDPKDTNQYVSVAVAVNRSDRRPSLVMFEVDPNADQQAGIDFLFAHTVSDGESWKVVVDPNGPVHFPFCRCSKTTCDFIRYQFLFIHCERIRDGINQAGFWAAVTEFRRAQSNSNLRRPCQHSPLGRAKMRCIQNLYWILPLDHERVFTNLVGCRASARRRPPELESRPC